MDDVISRQAAIDALCEEYCFGHHDCKRYPKCENLRVIQKLPSARPKYDCQTCRYNSLEWNEEPCDSCTMGGESNHYKPLIQFHSEGLYVDGFNDGFREGMQDANAYIVRCKDCKYYDTHECMGRDSFYGLKDDDFCSQAERREK